MTAALHLWWRHRGRPQRWALAAGAVVTLLRLGLLGTGTMAFVDESRYVNAMLGLRALGQGQGVEFLRCLNSMGARPGDGLWRALPGLGQAVLLWAFQLNPNAPPSLQVPQAFNVLIVSLNAVVLYRIYRYFLPAGWALLGVALYSGLVNTNVYLRHLLPYDHALFFFLLALWLLLRPAAPAVGRYGLVGLLAGFSYAVYPGYFMGPLLLLALGAGLALADGWPVGRRLLPVAAQMAGVLAVLGMLEGLARAGGTSYWASSRYIASTVTQGSFDEGFGFIITYFRQVEGSFGVVLLVLCGAGLLLSVLPGRAAHPSNSRLPLAGLLGLGLLAWLAYAGLVAWAHQLVFYGRILHFFVPLVVLGAVVALHWAAGRWPAGRRLLLLGGLVGAAGHFGVFCRAYRAVAYPADVAYRAGLHDARQIAGTAITACGSAWPYRVFGPRLRDAPTAARPRYRLVNFAYLYPVSCLQPGPLRAEKPVVAVLYFLKYVPYQFEGHSPAERELLQTREVEFQIFRAD